MVSALSENCNCGTSTVFCTVVTQAPVVVQQRASQPCPRTAPAGSRRSSAQFCTVGTRRWSTTEKSTTLSMNWNWGTSTFTYDMDSWNLSLMITGKSTTRRSTRRPRPNPLKKFRPSPTTALKSSGNDGGYSQLHQTPGAAPDGWNS